MSNPVDPRTAFLRFREHGDATALASVFDLVAQKLLLVASHVADRGQQPEDLVQETFLTAIQKADRYDQQRPLEPWLVGILVNVTRNDRRRLQRQRVRGDDAEQPLVDRQPSDDVIESEFVEQLQLAIDSLPVPQREVMTLNLVHGMTPTEIAHATSRPVGTVKSWIHRSLDTVRQRLPAGLTATFAVALRGMQRLDRARDNVLRAAGGTSAATGATVVVTSLAMASVVQRVALFCLVLVGSVWLYLALGSPTPPAPPAGAPPDAVVATAPPPSDQVDGEASADVARQALATSVPSVTTPPGTGQLHIAADFNGSPFIWSGYVLSLGMPDSMLWRVPFTTGDLGTYTFEGVPFGNYALQPDRGSQMVFSIEGPMTSVTVAMLQAHDVSGRVVDAQGHGVAGAQVCQTIEGRLGELMPVAVCDEHGVFVVQRATPGRFLSAMAPGWLPSCLVQILNQDGEAKTEVELRLGAPAHVLHLEVVDEAGQALAGALLQVGGTIGPAPRRESDKTRALRPPWSGVSDRAGSATCVGVPRDRETRLYVRAPGRPAVMKVLKPAELPATLRVVSPPGATCIGSVRRSGLPLSAVVRATSLDERPSPRIPGWFWPTCQTFEGGRFQLNGVPTGSVSFEARTMTGEHVQTERHVVAGQQIEWLAEIGDSGAIAGKVLDADGVAMAGQIVCCVARGQSPQHATTASHGVFEFRGLVGSRYELCVQMGSHQDALVLQRQADVAVGANVVLQVPRTRVPAASLRGRWILPRADSIGLFDAHTGEYVYAAVAADGSFAFPAVPAGDYLLLAGSPRIELRRDVQLAVDAVVDLGAIEAAPLVDAVVTYGRLGEAATELFVVSEECGPTIAFARVIPGEDCRLALPPGRCRFRFLQGSLDVCNEVVDIQPGLGPLVFSKDVGSEVVLPLRSQLPRVQWRIEAAASGVVRRYFTKLPRDRDPSEATALRVLLPAGQYAVRCWSQDGAHAEANFTAPLSADAGLSTLVVR